MSEAEMMFEWEQEIHEGFRVEDDAAAAWCVNKIREAEAERERMVAWYEMMIDKATTKCAATVARMEAYLREYAEIVPMKETKTQMSYPIPGGKMVLKKAHNILHHDDEKVLAALKAEGRTEYIKTVEKLDWAGLKKEIMQTGEMLDGITVETVEDEFSVKLDGEG